MLKWVLQFILGWPWCVHRWTIYAKCQLSDGNAKGTRYTLLCEKCGDLKKRDLI